MSVDLLLFAFIDAIKESNAESATLNANYGDTLSTFGWSKEAERRWADLGAWRMTWWR